MVYKGRDGDRNQGRQSTQQRQHLGSLVEAAFRAASVNGAGKAQPSLHYWRLQILYCADGITRCIQCHGSSSYSKHLHFCEVRLQVIARVLQVTARVVLPVAPAWRSTRAFPCSLRP